MKPITSVPRASSSSAFRRGVACVALASVFVVARAEDPPPKAAPPALVVRVVMPDGAPISDAEVALSVFPRRLGWTPRRDVEPPAVIAVRRTGEDGKAAFDAKAYAEWRIVVKAAGRATAVCDEAVHAVSPETIDVRMADGFSLEGVVTDEQGVPSADTAICAGPVGFMENGGRATSWSTTTPAGRYRLEGLPRGAFELWGRPRGAPAERIDRFAAPGPTRHDFAVRRRARVAGKVLDATGAPIVGARVWAVYRDCETVSGADGSFELRPAGDSERLGRLVVTAPGRRLDLDERKTWNMTASRAGEPLTLYVPAAAHMTGRVLCAGRPVADAAVVVWAKEEVGADFVPAGTARSDADGAFVVNDVRPGKTVVSATADGYAQAGWNWRTSSGPLVFGGEGWQERAIPARDRVTVPEQGDVRADVELVQGVYLAAQGRVLSKSVWPPVPVAGVVVGGAGGSTLTDADGVYRLDRIFALPRGDGSYDLDLQGFAHCRQFDEFPRWVQRGPGATVTQPYDAYVTDMPRVHVRVVDPDGAPICGATVALQRDEGRSLSFDVTTDAEGRGVLWWSDSIGGCAVACAPGFAPGRGEPTRDRRTTDSECEIRLERARRVAARVVESETGRPIVGVPVRLCRHLESHESRLRYSLWRECYEDPIVGWTDANGSLVLGEIGSTPLRIHVTTPGRFDAGACIRPDDSEITLAADPRLSIAGRVEWDDAKDRWGGTVVAVWRDPPPGAPQRTFSCDVAEDGSFCVRNLRPGSYELETARSRHASGGDADDRPGPAPTILGPVGAGTSGIVLKVAHGRTLRGRVVGDDGASVTRARVWIGAARDAVVGTTAITNELGEFVTARAPQGSIYVRATVEADYAAHDLVSVELGPVDPQEEPLQIPMRAGLSIEGRLPVDGELQQGVPLVAVPVDARYPSDRWWNSHACLTDKDGHFRFRGLDPGVYRLYVEHAWIRGMSGCGTWEPEPDDPKPIDADPGTAAGARDVTLTLK